VIEMKTGAGSIGDLQAFKARFFKALAHPIRIRLIELLVQRARTVQELQGAVGLDQSGVSQHLAVLRANHVVTARKEGVAVRYALRDPLVGDLLSIARRIFGNQLAGTQNMLRELKREHRRR
jgi:DNA-binding transcriptional ArsR family regulator